MPTGKSQGFAVVRLSKLTTDRYLGGYLSEKNPKKVRKRVRELFWEIPNAEIVDFSKEFPRDLCNTEINASETVGNIYRS